MVLRHPVSPCWATLYFMECRNHLEPQVTPRELDRLLALFTRPEPPFPTQPPLFVPSAENE